MPIIVVDPIVDDDVVPVVVAFVIPTVSISPIVIYDVSSVAPSIDVADPIVVVVVAPVVVTFFIPYVAFAPVLISYISSVAASITSINSTF